MTKPVAIAVVRGGGIFDLAVGPGLVDLPVGTYELASATASEGRIAELEAALRGFLEYKGSYNPKVMFEAARAVLAGSATPSAAPADFDDLKHSFRALLMDNTSLAAAKRNMLADALVIYAKCFMERAATVPQDTLKNADSEDAARYRYLRDGANFPAMVWEALEGHGSDTSEGYARSMNEAIDAAMEEAKNA